MNVLELTRQLGAAIQADERYINYANAKAANDKDMVLQDNIGQFNLIRISLDEALSAEKKDDEKVKELNEKMRSVYSAIMTSPSMVAYNAAKTELDALINDVNAIVTMCANGEDPATCEPSHCTGSCSSCGGCH